MAILLYTYSITSIRAAKLNARRHREADGGQLDMRKESLRRHGVLDKVEGTGMVDLFRDARDDTKEKKEQFGGNKAVKLGNEVEGRGGSAEGRERLEEELEGVKTTQGRGA